MIAEACLAKQTARATPRRTSATRRSSCTAAPATCTGPRWSGTTATPGSCRSEEERPRCSPTWPRGCWGTRHDRRHRQPRGDAREARRPRRRARQGGRRRRARSTSTATTTAASCCRASGSSCSIDEGSPFLELSPLAGWGSDFAVGASVVTGIGVVEGVECMITANDPTVKGGASNPWTVQEDLPGQRRSPRRTGCRRSPWSSPAAPTCRPRRRSSSPAAGCSATSPASSARQAADHRAGLRQLDRRRRLRARHERLHRDGQGAGQGVPRRPAAGEDGDRRGVRRRVARRRRDARAGLGLADYLAEDERDAIRIGRRIVARLNWRKRGRRRRTCVGGAGRRPRRAARPDPDRPEGAVRPARGDRPHLRRRLADQRRRLRRVQAALRLVAGHRLGQAARPSDRHPRQRPGRAVQRGGAEGRPSSSSSPTRSTPRCCSCTTPPATWSARSTSRAASSSTARR